MNKESLEGTNTSNKRQCNKIEGYIRALKHTRKKENNPLHMREVPFEDIKEANL